MLDRRPLKTWETVSPQKKLSALISTSAKKSRQSISEVSGGAVRRTPTQPRHGVTVSRRHAVGAGSTTLDQNRRGNYGSRVHEAAGGGAEDCIPMIEYSGYATAVSACKYLHFNT